MKLLEPILQDRVLKLLLLGIFGPVILVVLDILTSYLGIKLSLTSGIFNYLLYIFGISLFSLAMYIPFFKKTTTPKTKETKALIFIWILVSLITLLVLAKIYPDQLSTGEGLLPSPSLENISLLLLIFGAVLSIVGIPFIILNLIMGKSSPQKRQVIIFSVGSAVIASLISGGLVYIFKPNFYITEFPYINEELNRQLSQKEWVCDGIVYSRLNADKDSIYRERDGVKGLVEKDKNKINIKIDGDLLNFNTQAAFEVGITEGEPFQIVRNDMDYLVAVDTNDDKTFVDTIVLEKSTGLATWTKNRTSFFPQGHPEAQSFYLICR